MYIAEPVPLAEVIGRIAEGPVGKHVWRKIDEETLERRVAVSACEFGEVPPRSDEPPAVEPDPNIVAAEMESHAIGKMVRIGDAGGQEGRTQAKVEALSNKDVGLISQAVLLLIVSRI